MGEVENSILTSTKKLLGIPAEYSVFDADIIMHINTVFTVLNQLGVGPREGFMIEDDTAMWSDFIGSDLNLQAVKTYVYMKVRLMFDPPTNGSLIEAMNNQVSELEWRLNVTAENK